MSQSRHSFTRMLLKGLIMFCLALAAPLALLILIQVSGLAGPDFLYVDHHFMGDQMLIAVGALLGVALLSGVALWRHSLRMIGLAAGLLALALAGAAMAALVLIPNPLQMQIKGFINAVMLSAAPLLRSEGVLIGGTGVFIFATSVIIALMALSSRRGHRVRTGRPYAPEAPSSAGMAASPAPAELTFHQCAMKIQFKLTHLEEKVNDLETVLMRRAADPE